MSQSSTQKEILDQVIRVANELKGTENPVTKSSLQEILLKNTLAYINDGFPERLYVTANIRNAC